MPAYINPRVLDLGLTILDTEATVLHLLSQQPVDFTEIATYTLANKTAISIGAPEDRVPSGRKVTLAAVEAAAPGNVTATGSATHYAIADDVNSRLLAAGPLSNPQALTLGNTFVTAALDIGIPAPD